MIAWQNPDRKVILASRSPRRVDILTRMGITFEITAPEIGNEGEHFEKSGSLAESLKGLAKAKALSVSVKKPDALVLGADTIVITEKRVMGKPGDRTEAFEMLRELSGASHTVMTGVTLTCQNAGFSETMLEKTEVVFRNLTEQEIEWYLRKDEYIDKAGAYGIQNGAMIFISGIQGCFYNVMGLPIASTIHLFEMYSTRKETTDV